MGNEAEALDYMFLEEEFRLTKAKLWPFLGSLHATLVHFKILKMPLYPLEAIHMSSFDSVDVN